MWMAGSSPVMTKTEMWAVARTPQAVRRSLFRLRDRENESRTQKAPRNEPRRLLSLSRRRSVGLLDRREFPVAAALPRKGPDLGCFSRRIAARDQAPGAAFQR